MGAKCADVVYLHTLPDLEQVAALEETKDATLFALSENDPPSLCVAIKRRVLIFAWQGGGFVRVKVRLPSSDWIHSLGGGGAGLTD
jgi:hypothetical protein